LPQRCFGRWSRDDRTPGYRKAIARREKRNAYLRELGAGSGASLSAITFPRTVAAPDVPELTEEQLGLARFALDRALQPVPEFKGYDKIEQFQTSSIRYQVAVNGYALTALQYAHTPAFHGYLSLAQRNCIANWQERICWAFWAKESLWGHLRYNPQPDSPRRHHGLGLVGNLVAGYAATTGDHRYTQPGSISFKHPRG
jgi:hypothetical protein